MNDDEVHLMTVFSAALECASADRAAYLERACANDPALRERVEALLRAHGRAGGFLGPASGQGETGAFEPSGEESASGAGLVPGAVVAGRYKLLERVGEGGMGEVWMAEQTEPVRRRVALKVIKPGMDSRQVLARFEAERQALALMDHPNIAKVLDAGSTAQGQPFFVMELVKGVTITRYCDDHRLAPRDRLGLFAQVCQAVQHAHQKGVIHRDLKPSNVLVAPYDGRPVVKVIDFGIAKATGQPLTEKTLFTGVGAVVGTPEYMSPEQAELNNADVDTRSDVYALGVLLYELLTGTTPLTRQRLKEAALLEVLRLVREEEPPRPSTRLSATAELPSIAAVRGSEPAQLTKLVRGELDWIVMKALEKDRDRRYDSANGLALDLERFLAGEPVLAAPPSAWYRARKFAARHKLALSASAAVAAAVALVATTLVLAVVVLGVSLVLLSQEQAATEEARNEKETEYRGRIAALEGETKALGRETEALGREKRALESWRQTSALQATTLAFGEYQAANIHRAASLLDECPNDLRRWEWHYLKRLCSSELATCKVPAPALIVGKVHAISPRGDRVAIVDKGVLYAFDSRTGRELPELRDAATDTLIAFSADGRYLANGARIQAGYGVKVRETATGKVVAVKPIAPPQMNMTLLRDPSNWGPGLNDVCSAIALSADGELAAALGMHGRLFVWEVPSGKDRFHVAAHPRPGDASHEHGQIHVAFAPDGSRLATACELDTGVKIWDAKTGKQVGALDSAEGISALAYGAKGNWVATTGPFRRGVDPALTVSVWDTATGKQRHVLVGHTAAISCLDFSPDERLLATGGFDNRVILWDVKTGRRLATYCGHDAGVSGVSFRDDGRQVVSLGRNGLSGPDSVIKLWDATRPPECLVLKSEVAQAARFSPDSGQVSILEMDRWKQNRFRVRLWDSVDGKEAEVVGFDTLLSDLALSPDGRFIAAGGTDAQTDFTLGHVLVWDRKRGKVTQRYPAAGAAGEDLFGPVKCVAYSPDGKLLAAAGFDRLVHVWDTTIGVKKLRLAGHETSVLGLAFSRDGRRLTSVGWPTTRVNPNLNPLKLRSDDFTKPCEVKVWDAATGAERYARAWPFKGGYRPTLSPDGALVAVRTSYSTLTLYDVATGKALTALTGLTHKDKDVAVSPDGQRVVTSGDLIKLYDAQSGRFILTLGDRLFYTAGGVTFSPDGWKVAAFDHDQLRVWDATPPGR